jgi:cytidine deaminase
MRRTLNLGVLHPLDNGEIVLGSNQENAAYPQDYALNVAIFFHAGAIYPTKILKWHAASDTNQTTPVPTMLWFLQTIYCRV